MEFLGGSGEFSFDPDGPVELSESIGFLWHPWAIDCATRWLNRSAGSPLSTQERVELQRLLGHLILSLGDAAIAEATKGGPKGWTFRASETLYGLSSIPLPNSKPVTGARHVALCGTGVASQHGLHVVAAEAGVRQFGASLHESLGTGGIVTCGIAKIERAPLATLSAVPHIGCGSRDPATCNQESHSVNVATQGGVTDRREAFTAARVHIEAELQHQRESRDVV